VGALAKVTGFWEGLTGPSRRLLVGAVLIFVVGIALLMKFSGQSSYSTLASSVDPGDASSITKQLDSAGIAYKLADGGSTVKVASSDLDQARVDLASSGVLGGGDNVGFEIFDKSNLGATDFTNHVNLVRATEGELSRTISHLDPVQAATVKIAMPDQQLFSDEQQPTTAAVVLDLKAGQQLDAGQVKGIGKLVSMAVPGLKSNDVTITDSQGNILNSADADAGGATAASQRLAIEAEYERGVQSRLDAMLAAVLGPGKAVTQVHAGLDLDKVTTDSETFDKKSVVPLQSDTSSEKLDNGSGTGAGGAVGTSANAGTSNTYPAAAGAGTTAGGTNYTKTSTSRTNGVDRIRSQVQKTPGAVTQQSVAVQVSSDVPADVVAGLQKTIESAVGYDKARGDTISVQSVPFAADGTAVTSAKAATSAATDGGSGGGLDIMGLAKTAGAAIGLLLLALFARKSLRRRQSDLEKVLPELLKSGPVSVAELGGGLPAGGAPVRQLEGQRKSPVEEQMEDLAKRKPDDVAQLLRGWLLDGR
jgi:flagellar M-ring protein FliF